MRPTSGSVRIRGLDPVSEHRSALVNVGYSPELPNIQTFLTPKELLALTAEELIIPKSEVSREIKATLEIVGLTEYTNVRVSKLSKGMVQRLSIAQALIGSPDLLVMDDRRGVIAALERGLNVTGTLGLLARAAKHGILNLAEAFDKLKRTNFRYRQEIMDALLNEAGDKT